MANFNLIPMQDLAEPTDFELTVLDQVLTVCTIYSQSVLNEKYKSLLAMIAHLENQSSTFSSTLLAHNFVQISSRPMASTLTLFTLLAMMN